MIQTLVKTGAVLASYADVLWPTHLWGGVRELTTKDCLHFRLEQFPRNVKTNIKYLSTW